MKSTRKTLSDILLKVSLVEENLMVMRPNKIHKKFCKSHFAKLLEYHYTTLTTSTDSNNFAGSFTQK